ncbi:MAG TPA: HNH endonuclease [Gemmatimonadales bacterium]|nr:HNH endonuclease [Gemmatimonadales bacterium]
MTGALEVGERIIALLDEGSFTATYKYAVLLGLLDLSLEMGAEVGDGSLMVTTRQLAGKVLAAYWSQVRPLPLHDGRIPRQNGQGSRDARIVRLIDDYKRRTMREWSSPSEVHLRDAAGYERLLSGVERVLIEMPLPRLQSIGASNDQFLYYIGWTSEVSRSTVSRFLAGRSSDFDNRIILRPGVALALIQLNGLLRPLIQRSWSLKVAQLNHLDEAVLHDFLFGQERSALSRVRAPLVDLQQGRCFYCGRRLERTVAVDHFLPWARVPNNNLENLVAVHARCNGAKRDFLPALRHVARWQVRCDEQDKMGQAVGALAAAHHWPSAPSATLGTARAIYGRLPSSAKLWVLGEEFEERGARPLAI